RAALSLRPKGAMTCRHGKSCSPYKLYSAADSACPDDNQKREVKRQKVKGKSKRKPASYNFCFSPSLLPFAFLLLPSFQTSTSTTSFAFSVFIKRRVSS